MAELRNLHLLVPGLLGPMPTLNQAGAPLDFKLLERLLARAHRVAHPGHDLESVLFRLFGISADDDRNLPLRPIAASVTAQPPMSAIGCN